MHTRKPVAADEGPTSSTTPQRGESKYCLSEERIAPSWPRALSPGGRYSTSSLPQQIPSSARTILAQRHQEHSILHSHKSRDGKAPKRSAWDARSKLEVILTFALVEQDQIPAQLFGPQGPLPCLDEGNGGSGQKQLTEAFEAPHPAPCWYLYQLQRETIPRGHSK